MGVINYFLVLMSDWNFFESSFLPLANAWPGVSDNKVASVVLNLILRNCPWIDVEGITVHFEDGGHCLNL